MRAWSRAPKRASATPVPSVVVATDVDRGATLVSVYARTAPGLFYRICAGLSPPAATSSTRASTPPPTAWRSTISSSRTGRGAPLRRPAPARRGSSGGRRRWPAQEPSADGSRRGRCRCAPRPSESRRRFVDRQAASNRYTVVEVNARDRPRCCSSWPRRSTCGHTHPQRPYRHLWRARGRRLLPDRRGRAEDRRPRHRRGCAPPCSPRRELAEAKPPARKGPAAARPCLVEPISRALAPAPAAARGGGGRRARCTDRDHAAVGASLRRRRRRRRGGGADIGRLGAVAAEAARSVMP